jgi:predicted ATPase
MGYPDARLLELSADGIRETAYEETEHFRITRDFLMRRERILSELLAEDDSDPRG